MIKSKKMAILALSSCMALSVGTAIGVGAEQFVSAKADTEKYFVAEENYTATVSQQSPAQVRLTEPAGQYFVKAVITEINDKPVPTEHYEFYELVASVNGGSVNLNYNLGTHTFSGVIMTGDQSELTLTLLGSEDRLALSITLEKLHLGEDNDYILSNVTLPVVGETLDIGIDNLSGNYTLLVDLGSVKPANGVNIVANGTLLQENTNYYSAYSDQLTFDESSSIQITTDSATALTATISLTPIITYEDLPASVELEMYETVTYKFTATGSGYYSLNTSSTDSKAGISIFFKNEPEAFEGINVTQNNFPLNMVEGSTYYFDLTLMSAAEGATKATFTTAVEAWQKPTIEAEISYPVPATPAGTENVPLTMSVEEGNYSLTLLDVPFQYWMEGTTVTAHIAGIEPVELTPDNNYSAELKLSATNNSIYLVTSGGEITIVTLSVAEVAEKQYITLNDAAQISVPGTTTTEDGVVIPGNAVYYISLVEAQSTGFYGVTFDELTSSQITLNVLGLPAVFKGNMAGGFNVTYGLDEVALEFLNDAEQEVTFKATVTKLTGTYDLTLGIENNIKLNAGYTVYYLEGIAMGDYTLEVPTGATVYVDGTALTVENGSATFTVSDAQNDRGFVAIMFYSATASEDVKVTVTPLNVMTFNEALSITTVGDFYRTAYYIYLKQGKYAVILNTPENLYAEVTANNNYCVSYGGNSGIFEVEADGYVALRFTGYTYGDKDTFEAIVTDIAGAMVMGEEADITLPVSDYGKVYQLTGLIPGPYTINSVEGVEVYVDGSLVESSSFYVYSDTCSVMFKNTTDHQLTFKTTVTPVNLLTLNQNTTITIEDWTYSKSYLIKLTEGNYNILLTLPEGVSIEVTIGDNTVIAYGNTSGTFTVSAAQAGYVQVNFNTQSNTEVTFTAFVYSA